MTNEGSDLVLRFKTTMHSIWKGWKGVAVEVGGEGWKTMADHHSSSQPDSATPKAVHRHHLFRTVCLYLVTTFETGRSNDSGDIFEKGRACPTVARLPSAISRYDSSLPDKIDCQVARMDKALSDKTDCQMVRMDKAIGRANHDSGAPSRCRISIGRHRFVKSSDEWIGGRITKRAGQCGGDRQGWFGKVVKNLSQKRHRN
jgi:hypothetical protein